MSDENVEKVRANVEALSGGEIEVAFNNATPDFELDFSRANGPGRGVYEHDQLRAFWDQFAEAWESVRVDAEDFFEAGDHVVTPITTHVRGREGIELRARVALVWTFRDGTLARICFYQEREEALEAAGLSE